MCFLSKYKAFQELDSKVYRPWITQSIWHKKRFDFSRRFSGSPPNNLLDSHEVLSPAHSTTNILWNPHEILCKIRVNALQSVVSRFFSRFVFVHFLKMEWLSKVTRYKHIFWMGGSTPNRSCLDQVDLTSNFSDGVLTDSNGQRYRCCTFGFSRWKAQQDWQEKIYRGLNKKLRIEPHSEWGFNMF